MSRIDDIRNNKAQVNRESIEEYLAKKRDYETTFGTEEGKRVLLDMLTRAGFFKTNWTGNSMQYKLEGQREYLLGFQAFIPGIMGEVIADRYAQEENRIKREFVQERARS